MAARFRIVEVQTESVSWYVVQRRFWLVCWVGAFHDFWGDDARFYSLGTARARIEEELRKFRRERVVEFAGETK